MSTPRGRRRKSARPTQSSAARMLPFLGYWWRFRTTGAGKALIAGLVFSGSAGARSIDMPMFRLFFLLAAVLGVAFLAGLLLRPRVRMTARVPEKAVAGRPFHLEARLSNLGRFPAHLLGMACTNLPREVAAQPGALVADVPRGQTGVASMELTPRRRGMYGPLELRAFSAFPFSLFRTPCGAPSRHTLLVLPSFQPIATVEIPISARYQPGGIALTSNVGESPEYIGNRPYQRGDPLRRVDFKAWARLGAPAVREYQEEYYARIALILDTYVPGLQWPPPEGHPDLEAAVSLCAAIADALARGEYLVDLFAAGPELYVFRAGRHTAHFENVLEILACVDPCRSNPFDKVTPALAGELRQISAVVAVLLDWDASREALLRTVREHGCATKVLLVRTAPPSHEEGMEDYQVARLTPEEVLAGGVEVL